MPKKCLINFFITKNKIKRKAKVTNVLMEYSDIDPYGKMLKSCRNLWLLIQSFKNLKLEQEKILMYLTP